MLYWLTSRELNQTQGDSHPDTSEALSLSSWPAGFAFVVLTYSSEHTLIRAYFLSSLTDQSSSGPLSILAATVIPAARLCWESAIMTGTLAAAVVTTNTRQMHCHLSSPGLTHWADSASITGSYNLEQGKTTRRERTDKGMARPLHNWLSPQGICEVQGTGL